MKRNGGAPWWLAILLVLVPVSAVAAEQPPLSPQLTAISSQAQIIDRALNQVQGRRKEFTRGDESGVISYYVDKNRYAKIVVQIASDQSGDVTEYYFEGNQLIYVLDACKNFVPSVKTGSLRACRTVTEDRYFLSDGRLVGWLSGTGNGSLELKPVMADSQSLAERSRQISRAAQFWRAFVESPSNDALQFGSRRLPTMTGAP